jgi:hypothetical protein
VKSTVTITAIPPQIYPSVCNPVKGTSELVKMEGHLPERPGPFSLQYAGGRTRGSETATWVQNPIGYSLLIRKNLHLNLPCVWRCGNLAGFRVFYLRSEWVYFKRPPREEKKTPLRGISPRANYTDRCLSAKLLPTFADRGCHVVIVTAPYGRILGFLERSRYFFFQVAPQL